MKRILLAAFCLAVCVGLLCAGCADRAPGFDDKDIQLTVKGQSVRCGDAMSKLLSLLGEPDAYSEAISCAYDGLDKIYTYGETEIYTYPENEKDFVLEVSVLGSDSRTAAGIGVGASVQDVIAVYGEGFTEEGVSMVYEGTQNRLYFIIENGRVSALGMAANVSAAS